MIARLAQFEESGDHTLDDRPTGFQFLHDRYTKTESLIKALQTRTVGAISAAFLSILLSVTSLIYADAILGSGCERAVLVINVLVMIGTMILIWLLVRLGLSETKEETWGTM